MKKLLVILAMLVAMSSNLYSQMNFPLQVGNKFLYYNNQYSWWEGHAGNNQYSRISFKVLKDSTFNNHKYFLMNKYPNYRDTIIWVRFDSVTKSIYAYDSTNSCQYYFKETLIDSLSMTSGTANSCSNKYFYSSRIDTVYGVIGTTKRYKIDITNGYKSLDYNSVFGIIKYYNFKFIWPFGETNSGSMLGCYINGVKYGDTSLVSILQINELTPSKYSLSQNYPNPFNPTTNIKFSIVSSPHGLGGDLVQLKVYDIQGREVQTLVNERLQPGTYKVTFNIESATEHRRTFGTGVYFYKLITNGFTETKKMLLIK